MKSRSQSIQVAQNRQFDLVVIGGGIVGAGVAQDAAARGLSVALIEKDDFASGTSSKTTKLIHGGLRYLEQFEVKLTRELCQERGVLEQLAPHMVRDFSFVIPVPKEHPFFGLKAGLGLTVYDIVSWSPNGTPANYRHSRLSQAETIQAAPSLNKEKISGGLRYHDCITDDSRLVLEVVKSACHEGATAINYVEVTGFESQDSKLTSVTCRDRFNNSTFSVRAKAFVNAAGVWIDNICQMVDPNWPKHVLPSKGTHIIVPKSAFDCNTALLLPTDDGRYVFVVPWQNAVMIGTTDQAYTGDVNNPVPEEKEIEYLLDVVNSFSDGEKLTRASVVGSFAGLRPLIEMHGVNGAANTGKISREHFILVGPGQMIVLAGGKLTNYRLMATEVVDKVYATSLNELSYKPSRTRRIMLGGFNDRNDFLASTAAISVRGRKLGLEPATIEHLISNYGADAQGVFDILDREPQLNEKICPDFPCIMAEIVFSSAHEMAVSLEDLMLRRLRLGLLNQKQCLEAAPKVAELAGQILSWDNQRLSMELKALENYLGEHMQVACNANC